MRETQMIADQKTANSERLNWNAGGWFGAQIGGTCWIVICAALLIAHDLGLAKILFAMFMVTNLVGWSMWFFRSRITAYRAMQILLIITGVVGLAATFAIDRSGLWHVVQGFGGTVSVSQMYLLIPVMIAALLALFWSRNRSRPSKGHSG